MTETSLEGWLFRALMFEADSERFRAAGIRVGCDQSNAETRLLEEVLTPYSVQLRSDAVRMMRLYARLFCFENSVRELIEARLMEKIGPEWWNSQGIPKKIREPADGRRTKAVQNTWLEGARSKPLQFVDFGGLSDIIIQNWEHFSDLVPSQHWLKQRMDELEQVRNYIAHNRMLAPSEFVRIESYIGDWLKQIGA